MANCQSWQKLLYHIKENHADLSVNWHFKNQSKLEVTLTGRKDHEHAFALKEPEAMDEEYDKFLANSKKKEANYKKKIKEKVAASSLRGTC
ncbi:hypothetical protein ACXO2V_07585 [Lactobacillus delbrueckii subsp. bulgaricus]